MRNLMSELSIKTLSVVIPAYNEAERIIVTLKKLNFSLESLGIPYEIIIVDDGSGDSTSEVACSLQNSNFKLISYKPNRGKGYAVRMGLGAAKGEYVIFMDADGSTDLAYLERFLHLILNHDYDIIIGSRTVSGSCLPIKQNLWRRITGIVFRALVRILFFLPYSDTQCGFKMFSSTCLKMLLPRCDADGFIFDIEMLYQARKLGLNVIEVGVKWNNDDDSRVNLINGPIKMFVDLLKLRLKTFIK
ncbi:MAG: glycosyltransferase family 2 protein [Myxococcales bacterium]|nr:glycosyltransferase family 2 protein [Myxococcales bacterium]